MADMIFNGLRTDGETLGNLFIGKSPGYVRDDFLLPLRNGVQGKRSRAGWGQRQDHGAQGAMQFLSVYIRVQNRDTLTAL